eukprot:806466_1
MASATYSNTGALVKKDVKSDSKRKPDEYWFIYVYFIEGMYNVILVLTPIYLTDTVGTSVTVAGTIGALTAIPNIFRIPIGMISDKINLYGLGHRRPYIGIGCVMLSVMLFSLAIIDFLMDNFSESNFLFTFTPLYMVMVLFYQMFDGTVDGLIVETIKPEKVGRLQGILNFARGIGLIIAFPVFGYLSSSANWGTIFLISGFLYLTILPYLPRVTEVEAGTYAPFSWHRFRVFRERRMLAVVGFYIFKSLGNALASFIVPIYAKDGLGLSNLAVGILFVSASVGLLIGAYCGGVLVDRYRKYFAKMLVAQVMFAECVWLAYIVSTFWRPLAFIVYFFNGMYWGSHFSMTLSLFQIVSDKSISSSCFSIFLTLSVVAFAIGLSIVGPIYDAFGFAVVFLFIMGFMLLSLPFIKFMELDSYLDQRLPECHAATSTTSATAGETVQPGGELTTDGISMEVR